MATWMYWDKSGSHVWAEGQPLPDNADLFRYEFIKQFVDAQNERRSAYNSVWGGIEWGSLGYIQPISYERGSDAQISSLYSQLIWPFQGVSGSSAAMPIYCIPNMDGSLYGSMNDLLYADFGAFMADCGLASDGIRATSVHPNDPAFSGFQYRMGFAGKHPTRLLSQQDIIGGWIFEDLRKMYAKMTRLDFPSWLQSFFGSYTGWWNEYTECYAAWWNETPPPAPTPPGPSWMENAWPWDGSGVLSSVGWPYEAYRCSLYQYDDEPDEDHYTRKRSTMSVKAPPEKCTAFVYAKLIVYGQSPGSGISGPAAGDPDGLGFGSGVSDGQMFRLLGPYTTAQSKSFQYTSSPTTGNSPVIESDYMEMFFDFNEFEYK